MNELIVLTEKQIGTATIQTVNARELHEFLESKQQFADWIKSRVRKYDFAQGVDFTTIHNFTNSPPSKEFHLSLDMAKELAMVERNAKGKEARQYFLECERKLKEAKADPMVVLNDPAALRGFLLNYSERIIALEKKVETDAPKVEFHDCIVGGIQCYTLSKTAKLLSNMLETPIGRNKLSAVLRAGNVFMNQSPPEPYQQYIDRKLFKLIPILISNGIFKRSIIQTHVTAKGFDWLAKKFAAELKRSPEKKVKCGAEDVFGESVAA